MIWIPYLVIANTALPITSADMTGILKNALNYTKEDWHKTPGENLMIETSSLLIWADTAGVNTENRPDIFKNYYKEALDDQDSQEHINKCCHQLRSKPRDYSSFGRRTSHNL